MNRRSRVFAALLFGVLLLAAGCKDTQKDAKDSETQTPQAQYTPTTQPQQEENKVYTLTEENVRRIGRTTYEDGLWCAFSGTGAEFSFHGTKLTVKVQGDSASQNPYNEGNYARIAIYVNGVRVVDDMLNEQNREYTVIDVEQPTDAVVRIVKLSETAMSTFRIAALLTDAQATVAPTEEKETLIEFVGDSITCGYGVDDEDRDHHFSTATEDATKAYAIKTAQLLDADYSLVSISGYGIITGYSADGETKSESQIIPKYYTKLGFSYANPQMAKTEWDFSQNRQPDIVVINLGTNDDSYCKNVPERQEEYIVAYVNFLKTVREKNPDAVIVCALGIMGDNLFPCVEEAVSRFVSQTGDTRIDTLRFTPQLASDGYAADWHPTEATHEKAAAKLAEKLAEILK